MVKLIIFAKERRLPQKLLRKVKSYSIQITNCELSNFVQQTDLKFVQVTNCELTYLA